MKKIITAVAALFLVLPTLCVSATYYMRADGAAADKTRATGCNNASVAMSVATHNAEAPGFANGDIIYLCSGGGDFTTSIIPVAAAIKTITYKNAPGNSSVINGSTDIKSGTWVDSGSNVWSQTIKRSASVYALWYNTSDWGVKQASTGTINSIGDWTYVASDNMVYIYATRNPSTYYSGILIDNDKASIGINFDGQAGKVIIDGLTFKYFGGNLYGLGPVVSHNSKYIDVINCSFSYFSEAISLYGVADGAHLIDNNTFANGYNANDGRYTIWSAYKNTTISNNTINNSASVAGSIIKHGNGISIYEGPDAAWEIPTGCAVTGNTISNIGFTAIGGYNTRNANVGGQDINLTLSGNTITSGTYSNGDYDAIGIGGDSKSLSAAWKNLKIFRNKIDGYGNTGIHLTNYAGAESKIYYNIISNSGAKGYGGIRVMGGSEIYNNTIYNVYVTEPQADWGAGIWVDITNGSVIRNNIIHTISTVGAGIHIGNGVTATVSNNLTYNIRGGGGNLFNCTDSNLVTSDPLFISTSDFHLQSSSPAIDSGVNVGLTSDYAGNIVPSGSAPDIGAFEYQGGIPRIPNFPSPPANLIVQ